MCLGDGGGREEGSDAHRHGTMWWVSQWVVAAAAAATVSYWAKLRGPKQYVKGVEERVEGLLDARLLGQPLAVHQVSDAISEHLAQPWPKKPLVMSVHGPPGVGKSLFHYLIGHALYNITDVDSHTNQCPGRGCPAYKVVFGLDYLQTEKQKQVEFLRETLTSHLLWFPESLVVMEEYDKVDCEVRGLLKQMLDKGTESSVNWGKSIVVLESNTGYLDLLDLREKYSSRNDISAEEAQKILKDKVFSKWAAQGCEERVDTIKTVSLIDLFLPFFPLERPQVEDIIDLNLHRRLEHRINKGELAGLHWDRAVVQFLSSRIEFDGNYAIEGAKEVSTVLARYVTRALKQYTQSSAYDATAWVALEISQDGKGLVARKSERD